MSKTFRFLISESYVTVTVTPIPIKQASKQASKRERGGGGGERERERERESTKSRFLHSICQAVTSVHGCLIMVCWGVQWKYSALPSGGRNRDCCENTKRLPL